MKGHARQIYKSVIYEGCVVLWPVYAQPWQSMLTSSTIVFYGITQEFLPPKIAGINVDGLRLY